MPSAWAPEALKAQAVVARSYALAHLPRRRVRPLHGHAQPGLRRHRRRAAERRTRPCSRPRARSCSTTAWSRRRSSSRPPAAARPRSRTRGRRPSRCRTSSPCPTRTTRSRRTTTGAPLPLSPAALARRLHVPGGRVVDAQAQAQRLRRASQTLTADRQPRQGRADRPATRAPRSACARPGSGSASSARFRPKGTRHLRREGRSSRRSRAASPASPSRRGRPAASGRRSRQVQPEPDGVGPAPVAAAGDARSTA